MEMHSAAEDHSFHRETRPLRKVAYLLTIPCAIVPILIAAAVLMYAFREPVFFRFDFIPFSILYFVYGYGLFLSLSKHKNPIPILLFILHLLSLAWFAFVVPLEWLGYLVVVFIMITSIVNQYFRNGSFECADCNHSTCEA
jgi:hypothetical protein